MTATVPVSLGALRHAVNVSQAYERTCTKSTMSSDFGFRLTLSENIQREGLFSVPVKASEALCTGIVRENLLLEVVVVILHSPELHCPSAVLPRD